MAILNLFPTPVYTGTVNISKEETEYVLSSVENTHGNMYGNLTSNDNYILNNEIFTNINAQISEHIKNYVKDIIGSNDASLITTQSWLNYNPPGSSHHTHSHKNSIVSGVIYFTESPSKLMFFNYDEPWVEPSLSHPTPYNSNMVSLPVEQNTIVLFPSHLRHGVDINEKETTRISLAFNTFYTGIIGDASGLSKLELK